MVMNYDKIKDKNTVVLPAVIQTGRDDLHRSDAELYTTIIHFTSALCLPISGGTRFIYSVQKMEPVVFRA